MKFKVKVQNKKYVVLLRLNLGLSYLGFILSGWYNPSHRIYVQLNIHLKNKLYFTYKFIYIILKLFFKLSDYFPRSAFFFFLIFSFSLFLIF